MSSNEIETNDVMIYWWPAGLKKTSGNWGYRVFGNWGYRETSYDYYYRCYFIVVTIIIFIFFIIIIVVVVVAIFVVIVIFQTISLMIPIRVSRYARIEWRNNLNQLEIGGSSRLYRVQVF